MTDIVVFLRTVAYAWIVVLIVGLAIAVAMAPVYALMLLFMWLD